MCGIVGVLNRDHQSTVDKRLLAAMTGILSHRGPDDEGVFFSGALGMGHRRLAVIDLVSGHQPMIDEERNRALIYNGEIYNYRELRQDLISSGMIFSTNCDTEVLLKMATFSSYDWLEQLNGMFAFALWDAHSKSLLLARDRLGIKPLYYVNLGDEFLFASEIKALLIHPRVQRAINTEKMPEYLAFRSICGNETMLKGIFEVPPGHVMILCQEDFQPKFIKFWGEGRNKGVSDFADPSSSSEDQFTEILQEAVRYRLISDVPVGTYNSGGVDSSLVTAMMRAMTTGELHTFSVGFEEESHDERRYAKLVADKLGTHHHTLVINESQYVSSLQSSLYYLEEPLNHAHSVQLLHLSRFAKEYVTVVLTGEGSDELFGGYPRYQIPLASHYLTYMPKVISRELHGLFQDLGMRRLCKLLENSYDLKRCIIENSRFTPLNELDALLPDCHAFLQREEIYRSAVDRNATILAQLLYFDQRTYLPSLLKRLDKMSMAAAVECRVPFLDYRLVEWSYLLNDRMKVKLGRENKVIVKKAAEPWLPKEIIYRKKVGFGVPISGWFRNPKGLGQYLDILTDKTFKERDHFDAKSVEKFIKEHRSGDRDHSELLWGLLNLELWWRTFVDSNPVANRSEPLISREC